jgi:AraC-like DNA-binding protein
MRRSPTTSSNLKEIAALAASATTEPTATALPGVAFIKGEVPQHRLAAVYEPMIGFVVQGGKTISIGTRVVHLHAPAYFVIPTETPATGRVQQGPKGLPYLSVALSLNDRCLSSLLNDLPRDPNQTRGSSEFCACPAAGDFIDAWLRLLRLVDTPRDIPALAPVYEREVLYRVLLGPQGWRLRQLCFASVRSQGIHLAIRSIRQNYAQAIDIERLAAKHAMGVTTFHRKFKHVTGLSPIQFQKELRLLEARKLLVFSGYSAADSAYLVGYQSTSQFNREYRRLFGTPPAQDAARLRQLEADRQRQ